MDAWWMAEFACAKAFQTLPGPCVDLRVCVEETLQSVVEGGGDETELEKDMFVAASVGCPLHREVEQVEFILCHCVSFLTPTAEARLCARARRRASAGVIARRGRCS